MSSIDTGSDRPPIRLTRTRWQTAWWLLRSPMTLAVIAFLVATVLAVLLLVPSAEPPAALTRPADTSTGSAATRSRPSQLTPDDSARLPGPTGDSGPGQANRPEPGTLSRDAGRADQPPDPAGSSVPTAAPASVP